MPNSVKKAANDRTALIGGIIASIESKLGAAQNDLFKKLIADLVDSLDREGNQIKNTLRNKRLISLVDNVFTDFAKGKGLEVGASVIKGVSQIMDFNGKYFGVFTEPAKLGPIHDVVKSNLSDWLGISKTGKVEANGYLDTLISDPNIKNQVKDLTVKSIYNQAGYQETKKNLSDFITGNEDTGALGAMQKYYRNFVYDTFSQVDRTNAKLYADKLSFNYAIYEGGLIETSRIFCEEHNGQVFSRDEIAEFNPKEARPPGYNPFFDLGGYGCRHHLNWVPDAVAFALRPELKGQQPAAKEEPTPIESKKEIQKAETPFDQVKALQRRTFQIKSKQFDEGLKKLDNHAQRSEQLAAEKSAALAAYNKKGKDYQHKSGLTTEERAAMLLEVQKEYEKYLAKVKAFNEHEAAAKEIKAGLNKEIKTALLKDKPKNKFSVTVSSPTLKKLKPFMEEIPAAVDFFRAASHGWLPEEFIMNINSAKSGRAYYSNGEIFLSKNNKAKVIVHELGHYLETHNQVFKNVVDFLRKRTEGKPLRKLNSVRKGYGSHEVFKDGGFPNEYDGKIYSGKRYDGLSYTEIVSRGLEYMFDDPVTFYRKDKEFFNFIYSLFF